MNKIIVCFKIKIELCVFFNGYYINWFNWVNCDDFLLFLFLIFMNDIVIEVKGIKRNIRYLCSNYFYYLYMECMFFS